MIPMLRVFSRENLRGIDQGSLGCRGVAALFGQKNGPLGPTRAAGLVWTGSRRYLLEVSIVSTDSAGACSYDGVHPRGASDYSRGFLIFERPARVSGSLFATPRGGLRAC